MPIVISEWTKFRTLRSTRWALAATALLPVAVAVLVATTGSLAADDTVLAGAVGNAVVGIVPAGILGALLAAGEHGGGTMRLSVAAVPLRWPLLLTKAGLAAVLALVAGLAANAVGFAAAIALLPDHRPGDPLPSLLGVALIYAGVAVLGVTLGTALRSAAGAVTAVIGLLLLPAMLGPVLAQVPWLGGVTPLAVAQKVLLPGGPLADAVPGPAASLSVAIVCVLCLATLAPATWLLLRRDV